MAGSMPTRNVAKSVLPAFMGETRQVGSKTDRRDPKNLLKNTQNTTKELTQS